MRKFKYFDSNDLTRISYISGNIVELIGKYKRLTGTLQFDIDEKRTLINTSNFINEIEQGFTITREPYSFSANTQYSAIYNCYVNVRLYFPFPMVPTSNDDIKNEISDFKVVIERIEKMDRIEDIGIDKIEKTKKFFTSLANMTLEELNILDREGNSKMDELSYA